MKTLKNIIIPVLFAIFVWSCDNHNKPWTETQANLYYEKKGWVSGCNFIPSTAINQLEMWQKETFDLETIDRELGWAEDMGFNTMRVFLHHLVWENDRDGFFDRMNDYLSCSDRHGIKTLFVFLDDCWDEHAHIGKQREPIRGRHNSGWLKDPGALYYGEAGSGMDYQPDTLAVEALLKNYVQDVLKAFGDDERIYGWDLYNEPGGGQDPDRYYEKSFRLLKKIFCWAREINPSQPLTAGIWHTRLKEMNDWQIANSDIISYHTYECLEKHQHVVDTLKKYGRPVICTEYMARTENSTFQTIMPMLRKENVGAINWGLVAGKTNTIFSWKTVNKPMDADEPELWFHDILHGDGSPYDKEEVEVIRDVNNCTRTGMNSKCLFSE